MTILRLLLNSGLIEDLFVTCERIAKFINGWYKKNYKTWDAILHRIAKEKKGIMALSYEEKIILSEYKDDVRYYEGKLMAYVYILQELHGGRFDIPLKYPNFIKFMLNAKTEWTCREPDCPLNRFNNE